MGIPVSKTQPYTGNFYDAIRLGCQRSAAAVVPLVLGQVGPIESVVDVGCGEGWWGRAFADHHAAWNVSVLGIDGDYVENPAIPMERIDLSQPFNLGREFSLAVCLEVAEHLDASRAESFVADLVALAPTVVFSAAMPRQGGTHHVNCQPPAYWAALFREHGYGWEDTIRPRVWQHPDVESWYKSNLLIFRRGEGRLVEDPNHVIHPLLWLQPKSTR